MTLRQVTITLTRYREPDWLVDEALASLAAQEGVTGEVLFLDQDWHEDYAQSVAARSNDRLTFKAIDCEARCLSHARNEGLRLASYPFVLFTEPDIIVSPDWARLLAAALDDGAVIAGSRILPKWRGRPPILSKSRIVLDQYSLFDLGEQTREMDAPVRAIFGLNPAASPTPMEFDDTLGRRDGNLSGGEETELCERVRNMGGKVIYCGESLAYHQIMPERLSSAWILRRLYFAGLSRRRRGGAPSPSRKPALWDWLLAPIILPPYALGYLRALKTI